MNSSFLSASGRPGSCENAKGGDRPNEYRGSASAKASAVRALTLIENHMARVANAMEHGLRERDAFCALTRLRREITALQSQLIKARLEQFRRSADARQRARAAEVLDLLESRCEPNLQNAESTPAISEKDEGRR